MTKRWSEAQHLVAARLRAHLYPFAVAVGAGRAGPDVDNTPGVAFEVKARKAFDPGAWMRQAARQSGGDLPVTVIRPNGGGPTNVGSWPCLITLDDLIQLLGRNSDHELE